jgi:hypothetical protein
MHSLPAFGAITQQFVANKGAANESTNIEMGSDLRL